MVGDEGLGTNVMSLSRAITADRPPPPLPAESESPRIAALLLSVLVELLVGEEDMVSSVKYYVVYAERQE